MGIPKAHFDGYIAKCAVTIVLQERVVRERTADKQVHPSVIVVVDGHHRKTLLDPFKSRSSGLINESFSSLILIEMHAFKAAASHNVKKTIMFEVLHGDTSAGIQCSDSELTRTLLERKIRVTCLKLLLLRSVEGIDEIALDAIPGRHTFRKIMDGHVTQVQEPTIEIV